jgi:hypothetical protein
MGPGSSCTYNPQHTVHYRIYNTKYKIKSTEYKTQNTETLVHNVTHGPLIYTALYIILLMRANPLLGRVGGGWALEI